MAVLGIVAEYDPLHNGHLYHLNEAKKLVKPDLTYVVLSPCMKQRGDLPLLSPMLGNMLGSGERDTGETMTIVNTLVLRFFNCYLKGEGAFTAEEIY